jgi:hypothetical protein
MDSKNLDLSAYREFPVGSLESGWAKRFFQRKVTDTHGVRYYINLYIDHNDGVVLKGQFRMKEGTLNFELFSLESTLEEAEAFFERLWTSIYRYEGGTR